MNVVAAHTEATRDGFVLHVAVDTGVDPPGAGDDPVNVSWDVTGASPPDDSDVADALAAGLLLPAMSVARPLRPGPTISARLRNSLLTLQTTFRDWSVGLHTVEIVAAPVRRASRPRRGSALFFSGGVDSWFALRTREREYTHLVMALGGDVEAGPSTRTELMNETLCLVAAGYGLGTVIVRTDARALTDRFVHWELYHGAALASFGLLLGGTVARCDIAATQDPGVRSPWGSHPATDPLWSTERVSFANVGGHVSRFDRIRALVDTDLALATLRVCWQPGVTLNCGRCRKCLAAMAALRALGASERATTFPALDLDALASVVAGPAMCRLFWSALVEADRHGDIDLVATLRAVLGTANGPGALRHDGNPGQPSARPGYSFLRPPDDPVSSLRP